ncbi:MAG TPA: hypothetical protein VFB72_16680 [Verrucomicrobiae bacterium]|nr:hypothetical protein [Verrucomicrobiae bacterium]
MAKAVSTLVSIKLLIAADRAADYWHRFHDRDTAAQINSRSVETDAASPALTPRIIPTNFADQPGATLIPTEQP